MRKTIFIILLCILFASCGNRNTITVLFENSNGLKKNDPVILDGLEVGNVHRLSFDMTKHIIADIELDKDVRIPADSRFIITGDLLGNKNIQIVDGTKNIYLHPGDTVKGIIETGSVQEQMNNAGRALQNFIETKTSTQDSILIELRRLNDNLEKMNKN